MLEKTDWLAQIKATCAEFSGQCGLVILDPEKGALLLHNPHLSFSAASLIKLPMMLHYGLLVQKGELDPQRRLPLCAEHKVPGSGVLQDLAPDCMLTINDLVTLMIILSDNTATNMVIDLLGMPPVNTTIKMLDLTETRLRRKMYDWEAQAKGLENTTSAQDMADLLLALWQGEHLEPDMRQHLLAILGRQHYQNKLPFLTPDKESWAHKTGELDDADHDAGFLLLDDRAVIIALLTSDGRGQQERVQLANEVGKLVYEHYVEK
jgi:beta-lactamase class A